MTLKTNVYQVRLRLFRTRPETFSICDSKETGRRKKSTSDIIKSFSRTLSFILLLVLTGVISPIGTVRASELKPEQVKSNQLESNRAKSETEERWSQLNWVSTDPLVAPVKRTEDPCYSVKDPSIVRHNGKYYLFMTIRSEKRTHQIEFVSFADWKEAGSAQRVLMKIHPGYYCAPQVFYFAPQKKWYLICQASSPDWKSQPGGSTYGEVSYGEKGYGAAFSTTDNIDDPYSWTPLKPMGIKTPRDTGSKRGWTGLDFWVISDGRKVHFFLTRNNGEMWRAETNPDDFPFGWSEPVLALKGDIFEASHTYKIKGENKYLTIIEAINRKARKNSSSEDRGVRYYKAYFADRLDGIWKPAANSKNALFASFKNVKFEGTVWSESFSHGELLRAGCDEKMEIDPSNLKFLYQGCFDKEIHAHSYGDIPWRLGILKEK